MESNIPKPEAPVDPIGLKLARHAGPGQGLLHLIVAHQGALRTTRFQYPLATPLHLESAIVWFPNSQCNPNHVLCWCSNCWAGVICHRSKALLC